MVRANGPLTRMSYAEVVTRGAAKAAVVEWPPTCPTGRRASRRPRPRPVDPRAAPPDTAAAPLSPDGRGRLTAPRGLQSWPGIVHGGAVLALCKSLARAWALPPRRTV